VRDPYGDQLHRMNTVFKAYIQGWTMLSLVVPVLLRRATGRVGVRRALVAVSLVLALPHLPGMLAGAITGRAGLDGLRWMSPGDRAIVRYLRSEPAGATLVEAVGDPYSEYARLSAASGVPAFLGWANHESVWRGSQIGAELTRRSQLVQRLYSCGDPDEVRRIAAEIGTELVAVGMLERRDFAVEGLEAVVAAGEVVVSEADSVLVRVGRGTMSEGIGGA